MEGLYAAIFFLIGFFIGAIVIFIILNRSIKSYKKTAQLYFDMYVEAAETISDLVINDVYIDDLK